MDIAAAIKLLRNAGYLVFEIPDCKRQYDHGRHVLITRSASCAGRGEIPHGLYNTYQGSFGLWINCQCGESFSDYTFDGGQTSWQQHKEEHDIAD